MNINVVKTLNYMKRNGVVNTIYAVAERLSLKGSSTYEYKSISEEERLTQIEKSLSMSVGFSIVVPSYETKDVYMHSLIKSVQMQTYGKWELIIADASKTDAVYNVVKEYTDKRIKYIRLGDNKGISGNTNEALKECTMEYTCLLDHDDILTLDALYENAVIIEKSAKNGIKLRMLYSDEDKMSDDENAFFEANIKPKFNYDLILSNNYICHLLTIRTADITRMGLREEYDGAQDHDLILRMIHMLKTELGKEYESVIYHIPKVLYHWRCHALSTALNPKSKEYAYDAGQRAVIDHLNTESINATVTPTNHVGFFRVNYEPDIFASRKDVCALGGRVIGRGAKIKDGVYDEDQNIMFEGLSVHNSGGYLHRASCQMEVPYISVLSMVPNEEAAQVYEQLLDKQDSANIDYKKLSIEFCDIMRNRGFRFVYDPNVIVKGM